MSNKTMAAVFTRPHEVCNNASVERVCVPVDTEAGDKLDISGKSIRIRRTDGTYTDVAVFVDYHCCWSVSRDYVPNQYIRHFRDCTVEMVDISD
jgi:hypothetical protein